MKRKCVKLHAILSLSHCIYDIRIKCFSWRSGFYYYPQVFIFRRWNSSVKTQGQNSYSIPTCLLWLQDQMSQVTARWSIDCLLFYVVFRISSLYWGVNIDGERLQRLFALRESLPCRTGWRQRNPTDHNVTGSAFS